jgi:hypothetical protein
MKQFAIFLSLLFVHSWGFAQEPTERTEAERTRRAGAFHSLNENICKSGDLRYLRLIACTYGVHFALNNVPNLDEPGFYSTEDVSIYCDERHPWSTNRATACYNGAIEALRRLGARSTQEIAPDTPPRNESYSTPESQETHRIQQ